MPRANAGFPPTETRPLPRSAREQAMPRCRIPTARYTVRRRKWSADWWSAIWRSHPPRAIGSRNAGILRHACRKTSWVRSSTSSGDTRDRSTACTMRKNRRYNSLKARIVAGARSADHLPQFACLAGYDVLLLPACGRHMLPEITSAMKPDVIAATKNAIVSPDNRRIVLDGSLFASSLRIAGVM